ncbi:MAG: twin-arginine translocase subunit TatC [Candidatus Nezhaarchaeales archaeon]
MSTDKEAPLWNHLDELRRRLKVVLICVAFATVAMMIIPADLRQMTVNPLQNYEPLVALILKLLKEQVKPAEVTLVAVEFSAPLKLYFMASILFGLIVSMPVIAYEAYKFVNPALYPHERKLLTSFMTAFTGLFVGGAFFGYFILVPVLLKALLIFFYMAGAEPLVALMDFYMLVILTVLLTGLSFTIPAVFVLLVRFGFISTSLISKNRLYVYAGLFILTALITPDGGPVADFILFIPMIILLEAAIYVAKSYERKGEIQRRPFTLFPEVKTFKCKYCGYEALQPYTFCPRCDRSRV